MYVCLRKAGHCMPNRTYECVLPMCQRHIAHGAPGKEINSHLGKSPRTIVWPLAGDYGHLWAFNYKCRIICCLIAYLKFTHEFTCVIMTYWKSPGLQSLGGAFSFLSSPQGIICDIYIGHNYVGIYLFIKSVTFSNNEKSLLHSHCQCIADMFPLCQMEHFPSFVSPHMVILIGLIKKESFLCPVFDKGRD